MKKKTDAQSKERMIHVRLDEKTHRELKIWAVRHDTTIQSMVERLVIEMLAQEQERMD